MKIILTQDVPKLGRKHAVLTVKNGFGRNFLLPRGFALLATGDAEVRAKAFVEQEAAHREKIHAQAKQLAQKTKGIKLTMKRKGTKAGNLYGSVSGADIAKDLSKELEMKIDAGSIVLPHPIKKAGTHKLTVNLTTETSATFTVIVQADSSKK